MFVPAISTLLWVLVYSWPAEVISKPVNVATSPAGLQLLKGPQVANFTSYPELLITQAVNDTRSELFRIPSTDYQVELSSPAIEKRVAVETLQELLRRMVTACQSEIEGGRASVVPSTMRSIGSTPDNINFAWFNLDDGQRGSFADMIDIFTFLLFISTTERIPHQNPWFARAFSYVAYWGPGSPLELVGRGIVGLP